jgi:hypothetical protein
MPMAVNRGPSNSDPFCLEQEQMVTFLITQIKIFLKFVNCMNLVGQVPFFHEDLICLFPSRQRLCFWKKLV